jgi:uncharacterized surface protein with fasciclin (FAS1) repeats
MKGLFCSRFCLLALLILSAIGVGPMEAKPAKILDMADAVAANRILTKLSAVLQASDMATFLSSKGPFTLFAPTDSAFSKLPPGTLGELLRPENKERLQHILLFHVVSGKKPTAKDMLTIPSLMSCEGSPLSLKTTKSGAQFVLKAKIIHADIKCENGIIHEIDTVLMPPESSLPPLAPPPAPAPPPPTNAPANPSADTNTIPVAPPAPSDTSTSMGTNAASATTNAAPVAPAAPEVPPH